MSETTYRHVQTLTADLVIRVDADGKEWTIPADPANADWQRYQEWLAEGNTPEPWPPAE